MSSIGIRVAVASASAALLLLATMVSAAPPGYELDTDLLEEFLPPEVVHEAVAPVAEEIGRALSDLELELDSATLDQLAARLPDARLLARQLATVPVTAPYLPWLDGCLEYLEMADALRREPPEPVPPASAAPVTKPRPRAAPPARAHARWRERIRAKPAPRPAVRVDDMKRIFEEHGLPGALAWVAEVESSWNPDAVSPAGAAGLYQFMPATARAYGLRLQPDDERRDPRRSATAASLYLSDLYRRFNDWPLALAAYNTGENRVGRLLADAPVRTFEGIYDRLPAQTQLYVPRIDAVLDVREETRLADLPPPRPR